MRGLFIVPTDYDSLVEKGVAHVAAERDEEGFLERVVTVHPFASKTREVRLSDKNRVLEFQFPVSRYGRLVMLFSRVCHLLGVISKVRSIITQEQMTFVRAQDLSWCGLIGWLAARSTRRPFCISIHADYDKMHELDPVAGAPRLFGSRGLARVLESWLLKRADRVLAITEYIARYAERRGASRDKLRIFRHRIDIEYFGTPREPTGLLARLPKNRAVLSTVARLSKQKFVYDVIELAKRLRQIRDDFVIVMAGDGAEHGNIEKLITEQYLDRQILLTGALGKQDVAHLRQTSRASLCLIDGASLVEACAAGTPVVAYDVEWHSEILRDQVTGFLVPEGDIDGLQRGAVRLLDDIQMAKEMGQACLMRARELYDRRSLTEAHISAYQDLCGISD